MFAASFFQISPHDEALALGYVIPAIRAYSRLPPVRQCSCRAYNQMAADFNYESAATYWVVRNTGFR